MVKLDRIYTRGGDQGETSLGDGTRVRKDAARVEAYGTVDELNAALGLVRLETSGEMTEIIARIQNDLFDLGADLCTPEAPNITAGSATPGKRPSGALRMQPAQVSRLEQEIDRMNEQLRPLSSFILPGGTRVAAYLHVARTVARRAERLMVTLAGTEPVNPEAVKYMNRLSDHLFVLGRWANDHGAADILWVPGANRGGA